MLRLFLLTLALCHAVFAFPQEANNEDELSRDMELLMRALERKVLDEAAPAVTLVDIVNLQTEQSSTLVFNDVTFGSGNAVDKNFNSDLIQGQSCTHTAPQNNPWWRVYLREPHCIVQVGIVNRRDGDYDRLTGAVVRVGGIGGPACGSPVTAQSANIPGGMNLVICDRPIVGDQIVIHIPRDGAVLQICEVQVWAVPMKFCM
ncbi:fucolectin-like [Patiria miniata]|uniref:Fucolectin tachylectin-4 pentraxin-1 domain-containing protein n=1 Tax=Patiria miniata TaxID=46514 RepID=A0A913Z088_PATMI|nr:fucolectin-like [Patiria miniata]